MYVKDPDVALITAKTLSVQRCTFYALNGRHLVYVAEEAEPGRGAKLGFFFFNSFHTHGSMDIGSQCWVSYGELNRIVSYSLFVHSDATLSLQHRFANEFWFAKEARRYTSC